MLFGRKKANRSNSNIHTEQDSTPAAPVIKRSVRLVCRIVMLGAWAPVTVAFYCLFSTGLLKGIFTVTGEEQGRLLNTYTILLGFYITVRYVFFQLRDSKSLARYRATVYWMLAEYSTYIGWLLIFASTVIGVFDYILHEPSLLLYSIELSLFFTALFYAFIDFFCATQANRYI